MGSKPATRKVLKEVEEIDEFGNVRKVLREVEEEGIKKAPKTRALQEKIIIDKDGNKVRVLVDDQGNVVDQKDVVYEDEQYIDEFGNVRTRKVAKIKEDAMKRMQEKEKEDIERYASASKPKRTVLREVEEIDEFGNVRKVLKEVEEEGVKRAPKTRELKEKIIIDKYGNKKKVLVDDEGNVVDEDDVVYEDEEYIDEYGNKRTRKVAKIKKDAMKRMQEQKKRDEERFYSKPPKRTVLKEVEEIDEFGNVR